jgi:hypothetical protein
VCAWLIGAHCMARSQLPWAQGNRHFSLGSCTEMASGIGLPQIGEPDKLERLCTGTARASNASLEQPRGAQILCTQRVQEFAACLDNWRLRQESLPSDWPAFIPDHRLALTSCAGGGRAVAGRVILRQVLPEARLSGLLQCRIKATSGEYIMPVHHWTRVTPGWR